MQLLHALAVFSLVGFTGCGNLLTDAATRLSRDLEREASVLRASPETTRTFEHHPSASPEGVSGDYCIEFARAEPDGRSVILVGDDSDGPLRWHTTAHNRSVHTASKLPRAASRRRADADHAREARQRDLDRRRALRLRGARDSLDLAVSCE